MKTLHFSVVIHAARPAVWDALLGPETYRNWTSEFMEGSYYEGSWEEGGRIRFLGPDGSGMVAVIEENRPHELVSIRHLGIVKDGVEDTESDEVRSWTPAYEKYMLSDEGTSTRLDVAMDVMPQYEEYMAKTWPRALARLKALCESPAA